MKSYKLLVVEHDEKTRQSIDEILSTLGYKYDVATSVAEARQFLASDGHALVLMASELPARPGGAPRMQNTENLMEELAKASHKVPVVVMFPPMPHVDEEDKIRWAADMRSRGATSFVIKPFRTAGRTLDRVVKKLLAGQSEPVRINSAELAPPSEVASVVPSTLTEMQLNILEALSASPHQTMFQADIIEAGGYGKHATRQCLQQLEQMGFIRRPQGERKGFAVTDEGRGFLGRVRPGTNDT